MRGGRSPASMLGLASLAAAGMGAALAGAADSARAAVTASRIYGYANIRRHLQQQKRGARGGSGSLAGYRHDDKREIARRLRQAERAAQNRGARWFAAQGVPMQPPGSEPTRFTAVGLSRRGRPVAL